MKASAVDADVTLGSYHRRACLQTYSLTEKLPVCTALSFKQTLDQPLIASSAILQKESPTIPCTRLSTPEAKGTHVQRKFSNCLLTKSHGSGEAYNWPCRYPISLKSSQGQLPEECLGNHLTLYYIYVPEIYIIQEIRPST